MEPLIHFWCPDSAAIGVTSWDPDAEPQRFASGVGHSFFELYARLRDEGVQVELGDLPSRRPQLVVAAAGLLWRDKSAADGVLRAIDRARDRYVLIRGDVPLWWHLPIKPVVEVMPNRLVTRSPNQRWLPPLPQRGMLRRKAGSIERVGTVAIKCNPEYLPAELQSPRLLHGLRAAGADLWIDVPGQTDGTDQRWHDFSQVDAVLCIRPGSKHDLTRKPATKLINSWVAGCIPIASPEPAYTELANPGSDVCFIETLEELPELVRFLNSSPEVLLRLNEGIRIRQADFEPKRVLGQWRDLVEASAESAASAPTGRYVRSSVARLNVTIWKLRAFHHGARVRNRARWIKDTVALRPVRD